MMTNEVDIEEVFTEWEDRINFLTDHIAELESQLMYYQNLLAEKDMIINQLKNQDRPSNTPPTVPVQTNQTIDDIQPTPSHLNPPPQVEIPPPNLNPPPDVSIQTNQVSSHHASVLIPTSQDMNSHKEEPVIRKRQCPQCGAFGFAIKEVDDKTRLLCNFGRRIYAKKRVCTKCRCEF